MKFTDDLIDLGAPEIFITGLGSAEIIGTNCIRFSMYSELRCGESIERQVRVHLIWPLDAWLENRVLYTQAMETLMQGQRGAIVARMGKH